MAFETEMEMVPNGGIVFDNQHCRQLEPGPSGSCGEPTWSCCSQCPCATWTWSSHCKASGR